MGSMFRQKMPTPQPVQRLPDQDDAAVQEARRKREAESRARGGRESTIMTEAVSNLGAA